MLEAVYARSDDLNVIPRVNRENYLRELDMLSGELPTGASLLQVGSMDGRRLFRLKKRRPDLRVTGLELEPAFVELAQSSASPEPTAHFICGDITNPPELPIYDYVVCLNNTLGYIADVSLAIRNMRRLGGVVVVSVYGPRFDDVTASEYFRSLGTVIDRVHEDKFSVATLGNVNRFSRADVDSWGGTVSETPLGYWVKLPNETS